ncbi:hypothetical protein BM527_16585 [Alteromonas sp. Mex14]|nr:hypothetical protein BM527_16585 [Alteromonas sp. Mex14]
MHLLQTSKGFTLVEILVTLVILGLSASLVAPAVVSWLDARNASATRNELASAIAMLPLVTERTGHKRVITRPEDLNLSGSNASFINIIEPIEIYANGFCKGGEISMSLSSRVYLYKVKAPHCEVQLVSTAQ